MWTRLIATALSALACAAFGGEVRAASKAPSPKIAVFSLRSPLVEAPRGMVLTLTDEDRGTLRELLTRFGKARKDKAISGVALLLDRPSLGWAQVQDIRAAIAGLREGGKEVHCHLSSGGPGSFMVAAACNRVSMVPSGTLGLMGLSAEGIYLKGLLDKLGIVADMLHCGAYKGSAEPLTRTGPSEEAQEQMNRVLGDLYNQMVETIATSRGLRADEVRDLLDRGPLTARQAAAAKLVDELSYRHEFIGEIRKRFKGAQLARSYGREKGPELDLTSPLGFFKLIKGMVEPSGKKGKDVIALVYVDGMINTGKSAETLFGDMLVGSTTLRSTLLKAAGDKTVKAVVLRIDSPGGSALASDIIYQASQVVRKAHKPLIASMGDVAASGGYYVAVGADAIFAEPGTVTGSIGVVGGKIALGGLFNMIGVTTHTYKFGKNADLYSMTRPFDDRQREVVMALMRDTYGQFKRCVTSGRGGRLKGDIDDLAGGRVYTGRQALDKGLIDKLGGLDQAIRAAAAKAKVTDYEVRIMPKPKTLFDYIGEMLGMESGDEDASKRSGAELLPWLRGLAGVEGIAALGRLAPSQTRALVRMLMRIELLRDEAVLTVTPEEWMIR